MASAIDTMGNVGTIERMATSGGTTVAIDAIDGISTGYGRNVVCVANINRIGFLKGVTIGDLGHGERLEEKRDIDRQTVVGTMGAVVGIEGTLDRTRERSKINVLTVAYIGECGINTRKDR